MREQKARIKKAKKEPTRQREPGSHMRITTPWGRAGSAYRPGIFIKHYLEEHGEGCVADIHHALSEEIERLNKERIEAGERPLRRPTYSSFAKYFHWFKLLGLVEPTGRTEPAVYDYLAPRVFYQLTGKGESEEQAWLDPIAVAHPEFRQTTG